MQNSARNDDSLKILHVLRAPLGGLFRHVLDLAREQVARGHAVGLITDSTTGGERATQVLAELEPLMQLGISRVEMRRNPHPTDMTALGHVIRRTREMTPDVVHGHGSKGALYARFPGLLPGGSGPIRAYTPHGGSFNYKPGSAISRAYMGVERLLERATDIYLFESAYIGRRFHETVGETRALERVVLNGISPAEFEPVEPNADAADFVYVGELRSAKGIDTLIEAIGKIVDTSDARPHAVLVGSGPDQSHLAEQAEQLGISDCISFPGAMPARQAFALGRTMIVPSRAESLPYVVLEAAGARVPMIATDVGGIPEIFGPYANRLIACNDADLLAASMMGELTRDSAERTRRAQDLAAWVASRFTIGDMVDCVVEGYRAALARRHAHAGKISANV